MATYDRYSRFRKNGEVGFVPFVNIGERDTDYFEVYEKNKTRLDILSYNYYKDANYGWLIMLANPEIDGLEYAIPDKTTLRIPYPLGAAIQSYVQALEDYNTFESTI